MANTTKQWAMGGFAVAALAVACYLLIGRSGAQAKYPSEKVVHCKDLKTGEERVVRTAVADPAPYRNPGTGERTLYPLYYCFECKHRFVPAPVPDPAGGPPKPPMIPVCTKCGASNSQPWFPEDPELAHPAGDADLPKLPA